MDNVNSAAKGSHRRELITTSLVGWIPKSPGVALRKLLYRNLFARLGHTVTIHANVEFVGAAAIEIGDKVTLNQGAYLDSSGPNNRISIGDQANFRKDAHLDSSGRNNQIQIGKQARLGWGVRLSSAGQNSQIILGEHVCLDRGVDIKAHDDGYIEIGNRTYIGPYSCLTGPGQVKIGQDCLIASHTGIYANNHQFSDPTRKIVEQGIVRKGIVIEDDCWLGSGVKVLDGVTIGQGCVIGAGAVVTKDIPPYSIAVGVPAKVIGQRTTDSPKPEMERDTSGIDSSRISSDLVSI